MSRRITMEELKSLEGKTFARFTVLEYIDCKQTSNGGYNYYYKCQCSCPDKTIFFVERKNILSGNTKSCGCLLREVSAIKMREMSTKYPFYDIATEGTRFNGIWNDMKKRCCNKNNAGYPFYGGRGIGIDWSWFMFKNFYDDMHESYVEHVKEFGEHDTTLERIDVNDMYCKENCTWATKKEQCNNRRTTRHIEYQGGIYTCRDLIDKFPHHPDVTFDILHRRIFYSEWDIDKALNYPPIKR